MPIPKTLNHDFFESWSPQMAYVLGFFAADGNMIRNSRGAHFISFKQTDADILRSIQRAMGSNHAIGIAHSRIPTQKTIYSLQLGSKKLFEDLGALDMTVRKTLSLRLPHIPKAHVRHFVRGYFDGDGCVYFRSLKRKGRKRAGWVLQSIFTCGSRNFLVQFLALLHSHGIHGGSIRTKTYGYDILLSHRDSLALYHLMYDTISATDIYLLRKYKKFRNAIETLYPTGA